MGTTRTDIHKDSDLELAALAKALAHPARIAIVRCLLKTKTCITGDLSEVIGLAQPTISQHLKVLKSAGIIQGKVTGNSVNYCINTHQWRETAILLEALFAELPKTDPKNYPCND